MQYIHNLKIQRTKALLKRIYTDINALFTKEEILALLKIYFNSIEKNKRSKVKQKMVNNKMEN